MRAMSSNEAAALQRRLLPVRIESGFTSITVAPDEVRFVRSEFAVGAASSPRRSTGARVTLSFACEHPLGAGGFVCVRYDFAGNGRLREHVALPEPTHVTGRGSASERHHYRLSYWLPPERVMEFVSD